jgi:hypothetical protein
MHNNPTHKTEPSHSNLPSHAVMLQDLIHLGLPEGLPEFSGIKVAYHF